MEHSGPTSNVGRIKNLIAKRLRRDTGQNSSGDDCSHRAHIPFDTGAMLWVHAELNGDLFPCCRAPSVVDRRLRAVGSGVAFADWHLP
jgi:hypothetical protein